MRPLFTGFYCIYDCDKPEVVAKRKADLDARIAAAQARSGDSPWFKYGFGYSGAPVLNMETK